MNRYLKLFVMYTLLLVLGWLASSLYFAKQSSQALDDLLSTWSESPGQYIAEVEVLDDEQSLFSGQKTVLITPSVPYLFEQLGDFTLHIQQQTGPLWFGEDGLRFGRAEWLITQGVNEPSEPSDESPIALKVTRGFSEQLLISGSAQQINTRLWTSSGVTVQGSVNMNDGGYQFVTATDVLNVYTMGLRLELPDIRLKIDSKSNGIGSTGDIFTNMALTSSHGILIDQNNDKNTSLNLSSTASVWKNNDTLDADFKVSLIDTLPLKGRDAHLDIQLRKWLVSGFTAYLDQMSTSSHLLRQAEWALEEVETTEQQDFYRLLRYQAESIDRLEWTDIITPMLTAGQSKLALDLEVNQQAGQSLGKLQLGGSAIASVSKPSLPLVGDMKITSSQLDEKIMRLLKRWAGRGSLREYETTFESDLAVRERELLMNNGRVSLVRLKDELMQTLIDQ
jgi:hypothetical protein